MDVNEQQCDGAMETVMDVGDIRTKMASFGAVCVEVDGHDLDAIRQAAQVPHDNRLLMILARTSSYHTMPFLKRRHPRLHYVRFKTEEERVQMNKAIAADLGIEPVDLAD